MLTLSYPWRMPVYLGKDLEANQKFNISSGIIKRDERGNMAVFEITLSQLKFGIHSHFPHRSRSGI